ncbi:hypothetical protein evm_000535 [Chilo suppressalis]|nr:hypothetical protein evm_000535 [Chilo suppressalis]
MDNDILISLVFTKQPLWDKTDKRHCNRYVVDKCWKEISEAMNEDADEEVFTKICYYFSLQYVVVSAVVLIFEVALVTVSYGLWNNVATLIRTPMTQTRLLYGERIEVNAAWDRLQTEFECCGVSGRHDWRVGEVPVSCCHIDYGTVSPFYCTQANAYTTGCGRALGDWLSFNAYSMAVTSLVVICFQIFNTAAACWLAYRLKNDEVELEH